ncbi:SET domain-containing protein 4 isoform X3 [Pteropus vampyrus]|uniref:SET domain-containing protein 4 isoform X3 n=1 Tax=Pteropus vampyrus TaxID=132908 RepID=A0A6P3QH04_PTEVA|nr:SET domain-containing protein 4 isoform X3 [Pteropus vampyrus]
MHTHGPSQSTGVLNFTFFFGKEGQVIISLPESCLLTTDTVIRSYLGAYVAKWRPPLSPLLALCTFLVAEKHAGDRSPWKPYLEILPKAYTCPVCLEPEVVNLLPQPLKAKAREQRIRVQEFFTSSRDFFSSLQPLFSEAVEGIFSYSALLWAWCTVNTRAVYVKRGQRQCFSAEPDTCALAPYLDLLNHSPGVQVKAAFNEETRCYEIRTGSSCRRHEEVFICYGPHDNQRLLLEYGFVAARNPHACVYVSQDILVKYLPSTDKQMNKKISILKDHDFIENLTFGWDGPSWRLLTTLKLLCLEAEELACWQDPDEALTFPPELQEPRNLQTTVYPMGAALLVAAAVGSILLKPVQGDCRPTAPATRGACQKRRLSGAAPGWPNRNPPRDEVCVHVEVGQAVPQNASMWHFWGLRSCWGPARHPVRATHGRVHRCWQVKEAWLMGQPANSLPCPGAQTGLSSVGSKYFRCSIFAADVFAITNWARGNFAIKKKRR